MALVPHKRKQPDTDTSSDTDTGSLAPRVLVRRKVNGGRALNGPEGWFPGADIPYETMRKFEGASKSSKPPGCVSGAHPVRAGEQLFVDYGPSYAYDEHGFAR